MLHTKSKPKEIEYYIQQVEMLAMSEEESARIAKIMALQELISDESIKDLIAEDLKDERWIEETHILINTCNKRQIKSTVLQSHIEQCKGFIVFRSIEDKLLSVKELRIFPNLEIIEIDSLNKESPWVNFKAHKIIENSKLKDAIKMLIINEYMTINTEWLYKNKSLFFTQDIFEDLDVLINKKKRLVDVMN